VIRGMICIMGIALLLCAVLPIMSADAQRDEATVAANWTFNDGSADDTSKKKLNGNIVGAPKAVDGIAGKALKFDGEDDGIKVPDSADINTVGPYTNRTIAALFNCDNVGIDDRKQVIYEEGGRTRGLASMCMMEKFMSAAGIALNITGTVSGPLLMLSRSVGTMLA